MMNEKLSGWIDGELSYSEGESLARSVASQAAQREACEIYWLIGDCLRAGRAEHVDITAAVMDALEAEPVVLAPENSRPVSQLPPWWMSMAAAVAGLGVAVWMGSGLWSPVLPEAAVMAATVPAGGGMVVAVEADALPDDRSYLMAHQASAMGSPMTGVAQYIRTVGSGAGERK